MADELDLTTPLAQTGVRFTLGLQFAILLAFNLYYASFPVYAAKDLGWTVRDIGVYFTLLSLLLVIVEGPMLSRLSGRIAEWQLVVFGLVVMAAHFAMLMAGGTSLVYVSTALFVLGNGLMWPSVSAMLSSLAAPRTQGAVQGFAGSVSSLSSIVGLLAGGAMFAALGGGVFGVAGLVMLASGALAVHLRSYALG